MDIEGTYKISIEQSARKRVEGLLETTNRLLGCVGVETEVVSAEKEKHIQEIVAYFKEDQDVIDGTRMVIAAASITLKTPDGEMVYRIKGRKDDGQARTVLSLESDEMGRLQWDVRLCADKFFMFESEDSLAEYVFEKV